MEVVYDYQIFSAQKYGGISRYFVELSRQFSFAEGVSTRILAGIHTNQLARELGKPLVCGMYVPYVERGGNALFALNRLYSEHWLRRNRPQICHHTYFLSQSPRPDPSCRTVVTIYDMARERLPDWFHAADRESKFKSEAIRRADHIICISESTRADLLELTDTASSKVSVVHLGFSLGTKAPQDRIDVNIATPYLLYVGDRTRYKNFGRLLEVYATTPELIKNFSMVCVGRAKLSKDEQRMITRLGMPRTKLLCLAVDDQSLASLYRGAAAFIYPSLYEGFGLPPLEAMANDCPVICSNAASLPEVAGDAAEYFDPQDSHSMVRSILRVVTDEGRASFLRARGRDNLRRFSWARCADETRGVYDALV